MKMFRDNTFGDFRKEKLSDNFSQIFNTLNDPRNKPSTDMEYEIVWNYKEKTYQEFSGENSFIEAIKKQYDTQSNNMDWISFIDLLLGDSLMI